MSTLTTDTIVVPTQNENETYKLLGCLIRYQQRLDWCLSAVLSILEAQTRPCQTISLIEIYAGNVVICVLQMGCLLV